MAALAAAATVCATGSLSSSGAAAMRPLSGRTLAHAPISGRRTRGQQQPIAAAAGQRSGKKRSSKAAVPVAEETTASLESTVASELAEERLQAAAAAAALSEEQQRRMDALAEAISERLGALAEADEWTPGAGCLTCGAAVAWLGGRAFSYLCCRLAARAAGLSGCSTAHAATCRPDAER